MTNRCGVASSKASADVMWDERSDLRINARVSSDEAAFHRHTHTNESPTSSIEIKANQTGHNSEQLGFHCEKPKPQARSEKERERATERWLDEMTTSTTRPMAGCGGVFPRSNTHPY